MAALIASPWVWLLIGAVLAAVGLPLLTWALIGDRSRGRRRCPKCWYDMAGVPGLTCPECGRTAAGEKRLAASRRRRWWATISAAMTAIAFVAVLWPSARAVSLPRDVPTWVLTQTFRFQIQPNGSWSSELVSRVIRGSLDETERQRVARAACVVLCGSSDANDKTYAINILAGCGPAAIDTKALITASLKSPSNIAGTAAALVILCGVNAKDIGDSMVGDECAALWIRTMQPDQRAATVWEGAIVQLLRERTSRVSGRHKRMDKTVVMREVIAAGGGGYSAQAERASFDVEESATQFLARLDPPFFSCRDLFISLQSDQNTSLATRYWAALGTARLSGTVKDEWEFHARHAQSPDPDIADLAQRAFEQSSLSTSGPVESCGALKRLFEQAETSGFDERVFLRRRIDVILKDDRAAPAELRRIVREEPDPARAWAHTYLREHQWAAE